MRDHRDSHPWRLGPRGRWLFDAALTLGLLVPGFLGHLTAGEPLAALLTASPDWHVVLADDHWLVAVPRREEGDGP